MKRKKNKYKSIKKRLMSLGLTALMTLMMLLTPFSYSNILVKAGITAMTYYDGTGLYSDEGCTIVVDDPDTITEITIKNTTIIASSAFTGLHFLKKVSIPEGVTSIGNNAFSDCEKLSNITLPESLQTIGESAFENCVNLTEIKLSDSLTKIGYKAFSGTGLSEITIGKNVSNIVAAAFAFCPSFIKFYVDSENAYYSEGPGGLLYSKNLKTIISFPSGIVGSFNVDSSVNTISPYAFYGSVNLTGITISNSVTSMGEYAFAYSKALESICIPGSISTIGENTFLSCSELKNVVLSEGVTTVSNYAFRSCDKLTDVTLSSTVSTLLCAFPDCISIKNITIPHNVTDIKGATFQGCTALTDVVLQGNVTDIEGSAFNNCPNLKNIDLPVSLKTIGERAFAKCGSLTHIVIPDGITAIGDYAFSECGGLTEIIVPANIITLNQGIFYKCVNLSSVELKGAITAFGNSAFYGCTKITSFTIPETTETIENYVFFNSGVTTINIPKNVSSIGIYAFANCKNFMSYTVDSANSSYFAGADGVLLSHDKASIVSYASGKTGSYTISDNVETIDNYAFGYCNGLPKVTIPASVKSIKSNAFSNSDNLVNVTFKGEIPEDGIEYMAFGPDMYRVANATSLEELDIKMITFFVPVGTKQYYEENLLCGYDFDNYYVIFGFEKKVTEYAAEVTVNHITTGYVSLLDAFAATQVGDEANIKLLYNAEVVGPITVDSGKTITLDLNGYNVSGETNIINNCGNLTVTDTGTDKIGTISTADMTHAAINNNGALIIHNVIVTGSGYGILENDSASVNIFSGTINGGIYAFADFTNHSKWVGYKIDVNSLITINSEKQIKVEPKTVVTDPPVINAVDPVFVKNLSGDVTYSKGKTSDMLTVEARSTDGGVITYQWYVNNENNIGGMPITGAVSPSFTLPTDKPGVLYYYVKATNTVNTNGNKTAVVTSGTFKEVVNNLEILKAEVSDNMPTTLLADSPDIIQNAVLQDADRKNLFNGSEISIYLSIKKITVPDADNKLIISLTDGKTSIGQYLDISLIKNTDGIEAKVIQTNSPITITIVIPQNMRASDRKFEIIRVHDGVALTLEDQDDNPNTITIITDKFSTYVLVYQDNQILASDNKQAEVVALKGVDTGDKMPILKYLMLGVLSMTSVLILAKKRKTWELE